jgi:hypothetical protein
VAGASWHLPTPWLAAAALCYLAVRLVGKTVGAFLATRRLTRQHPVPPLVGLGLASQGGMGLAIILEYRLAVEGPLVPVVVGIGITAIFVNDLLAPWLAMRVARHAEVGVS